MMKKVIYLLTMIFAVALMSTSCEKEDPIVSDVPEGITAVELTGEWSSISYEYSIVYSTCDEIRNSVDENVAEATFAMVYMDIVVDGESDINDECNETGIYNHDTELDGVRLTFSKAGNLVLRFEILTYENGVLKMKFVEKGSTGENLLEGSIYLLEKL